MSRAFITITRNDLAENMLQVLDLYPNTSYVTAFTGQGQTRYLTYTAQNDVVTTAVGVTAAAANGLRAYLKDNVENVGGGALTLTDAECTTIAGLILAKITAGEDLTEVAINALINTPATVTLSDLTGTVVNSHSTGSVYEVLQILSGEVYNLPVASAVGVNFPLIAGNHRRKGDFLVKTDTGYRGITPTAYTTHLSVSCLSGHLHVLAGSFVWLNGSFTYGASGTAKFADGTAIPATGIGRVVAVYTEDGSILV